MNSSLTSPLNGEMLHREENMAIVPCVPRESAETLIVAIDASKEITGHVVEWAVKNVLQTGDSITLLAILPAARPHSSPVHKTHHSFFKLFTGWSKLWGWLGGDRRCSTVRGIGTADEIHSNCCQMMQQLCETNNTKQVQTEVKILPEIGNGVVATEAEKLCATWVILDRCLKNEGEFCMKKLQCNVVVVDHPIPKILKFNLRRRPGGEALPFEEAIDSSSFIFPGLIPRGFGNPTMHENLFLVSENETLFSSPGLETPITLSASSYSPSSSDQSVLPLQQRPDKFSESATKVTRLLPYYKSVKETDSCLMKNPEQKSEPRTQGRFHTVGSAKNSLNFSKKNSEENKSYGGQTAMVSVNQSESPFISKKKSKYLKKTSIDHSDHLSLQPAKKGQLRLPQIASGMGVSSQVHTLPNPFPLDKEESFSRCDKTGCWGSEIDKGGQEGYFPEMLGTGPQQDSPRRCSFERTSSIRRAMSLSSRATAGPPPLCSICQHRAPVFGKPPRKFSYEELEHATDGFSEINFLAEGGYGPVYKGILPDGQVVAVKQHKLASTQGAPEFCAEVEVLSCAQHRNVVMLVGYCMEDRKWLLVYEFACNGSLDTHLYGRAGKPHLEWMSRQKVALGAARGLRYLHEECRVGCIVHRDLRPNNILLTHDFEAMVGDFGLARWQPDGQLEEPTRVIGTFGYLAPEYTQTGQITEKADVYSFGVLLLELVSGRKAIDIYRGRGQQCLLEWARPMLEKKMVYELIDPRLENRYSDNELQCMVYAASLCIRQDPQSRPRMSKVLHILEGDLTYDTNLSPLLPPSGNLLMESVLARDADIHQETSGNGARNSWSVVRWSNGQNASFENPNDSPVACSPGSGTSDHGRIDNKSSSITRFPAGGLKFRSLSAGLSNLPSPQSMAPDPRERCQPRRLHEYIDTYNILSPHSKTVGNNRPNIIFPSWVSGDRLPHKSYEIHSSASDSDDTDTSSSGSSSPGEHISHSTFPNNYWISRNNGLYQSDDYTVCSGESLVGFFQKLNEMPEQTAGYCDRETVHIGSNMDLPVGPAIGSDSANLSRKDTASTDNQCSVLSIRRNPSVDMNGKLSFEALKVLYRNRANNKNLFSRESPKVPA